MDEVIGKEEMIKRVTKKLDDTKIVIGGNKEFYKRKYHLKYTQKIVKNVINTFLTTMADAIEEGDAVKLKSYFIIAPKYCNERMAKNLIEGREFHIPAHYTIKFSAGSKFKEACERLTEKTEGKFDEA